ncbi:MAG: flippase activity-associated protein Agl23, partial [Anaerolineae bacterium]
MAEQSVARAGALQERLERVMVLDWEKVAWLAILVLAVVTRLWGLGDRAMSHDESLHTFYSWKLFRGQGYDHDPMMHGPLLFHGTALMFFLFGVNDFTARLLAVVFGIGLVMSPWLVRKWLSPVGALATAAILLASPSVMYYSRYIRHDILVEVFTVLMFASFFRYLDSREDRWIVVALAAAGAAITTAEMAYINGFVLLLFVALALAVERLGKRSDVLILAVGAVGLGLMAFYLVARTGALGDPAAEESALGSAMQLALALGGLGAIYALAGGLVGRGDLASIAVTPVGDGAVLADFAGHSYFRRYSEAAAAAQMLAAGLLMLAGGWMLGRFLAERTLQAGAAASLAGATPPLLMALGAALLIFGLGGFAWSALGRRIDALFMGVGVVLALLGAALAMRLSAGMVYGSLETRHALYAVVIGAALAAYGFLSWVLEDHDERPVAAALGNAPATAVA